MEYTVKRVLGAKDWFLCSDSENFNKDKFEYKLQSELKNDEKIIVQTVLEIDGRLLDLLAS